VKGAFPHDVTDTVSDLLELGNRMGYEMPMLADDEPMKHDDLFKGGLLSPSREECPSSDTLRELSNRNNKG